MSWRDRGEEREKERRKKEGRKKEGREESKTEGLRKRELCLLCPCRSAEVCVGGKNFTLQSSMVTIKRYQKTIHGE